MSGRDAEIIVLGGGVVGLSIAYGLMKHGRDVLLLDEGDVAHRASRGNFALVWVQGKGLSMPEYALWTLKSADLWADFVAELEAATGRTLAYSRRGGLMPALSDEELDQRMAGLNRLHNLAPASARVERLDRKALKSMLPALGEEVVGATYCPADGHVNALNLFRLLHESVQSGGARYLPNAAAGQISSSGDGFAIETAAGTFHAGKVVLAAGLGNARLAPMVGLEAPVRPQRGQVMVTEKLAPFLDYPLGTIRQTNEGGVMIGDSKEEVGLDNSNHHAVLAEIADRATRIFPVLRHAQVVRSWGALRVMSPDGHPIYDRSVSHPGAYLVTCHSGITLAAIHARAVAAAIASDGWDASLEVFSARRFRDVPAAA